MWLLTWRKKTVPGSLPALLASVFALPLFVLLVFDVEGTSGYYMLIGVYLRIILPFYALVSFGDLIRDEIQSNTLVFLTTRPLSRARLFLIKYLCLMAWIQLLMLAQGVFLWLAGCAHKIEAMGPLLPLLLTAQFLAVLVFGALSALMGLIHKRFLVLGVLYGLVVEIGIGQIPTNVNNLSMTRHLKILLGNHPIFHDAFQYDPTGTATSVLAILTAAVGFLGLGALLFSRLEFLRGDEMKK